MNCEWTEKISLLIDGELARDEAETAEHHLRACVVCRQAREDFLHLRAHISAYRADLDPRTQRAALAEILATAAFEKRDAKPFVTSPRGARFGERLAALLGVRANAQAWAAACVLIVAGALFGLILWRNAPTPPAAPTIADSQPRPASEQAHVPAIVTQSEQVRADGDGARETGGAAEARPRRRELTKSVRVRFERARAAVVAGETGREPRRAETTEAQSEAMLASVELSPRRLDEGAADAESKLGREFHIDSPLAATRHVEQAQLLLRSFRNVRLAGARGASDLAEERRRSQKLLYRNIVLRREAATKGDLPVERVLSSLEPILIDIANLPDRPEGDEVLAIRQRMERKNIVAMLQVSVAAAR
ncbi:MAG TPA: zf-HC2 domain-containing protein [Pyrinomonadaceae bacterium]|nr:zf-HC2 domain-containing protein [Pyrinomonadaceae bacterium]